MKTFKGITVVHLDVGEALNPAVEQEIDTADIVIDGDKVVKNRVSEVGLPRAARGLETFKGLSLEPVGALKNIAAIIECGHLMTSCSDSEYSEIGDVIIGFAQDYAAAAHAYALEEKK